MTLLLTTIKSENPTSELALKYLYGIVADAPLKTTFKIYDTKELDTKVYEETVREDYDIVYFHCDEYNEHRICNVCDMIKKAMPDAAIVVGGMQVSFDTQGFMQEHPYFDYVIRGEGETVMFNFLKAMITYDYGFDMIPGLGYRMGGKIVVNPFDALPEMEQLPFPFDKMDITDTKKAYYETIRGTSDRTVYNQFMPDARVRALPLDRVCTEIRYFIVKGVERVVILDKFFNYNTERAYRIFEYIINNDNGLITFELNINGDNLDDETIRLLGEAREGLFVFNLDIATTNPETLAAIGRGENIYQMMYNVSKLVQRGNIKLQLSIMAGLPMENVDLFARSFNKVYGLGEGCSLKIDILRIPKGCALRNEVEKLGYIFRTYTPHEILGSSFIGASDLIIIKAIAKLTSLYVTGEFVNSFDKILTDTGIKPYDLFSKFAQFLYSTGLESKLGKKENLYRLLYKFACNIYDEYDDALKLQILQEVIHGDLEKNLPPDAVKKFERKGWEIEA